MRRFFLALAVAVAALGSCASAHAGWPGANGKIVFTTIDGCCDRIWTVDANGDDLQQLPLAGFGGEYARNLELSPNGKYIALLEGEATPQGFAIVNLSGAQVALFGYCDDPAFITCSEPLEETPHWSPDGSRVVFVDGAIGVYDLARKETIYLPGTTGGTDARWSSDGTAVSYTLADATYISAADGSGSPLLAAVPFAVSPGVAPISPNGQKQVFLQTMPDGSQQIFTSGLDGENALQVTDVLDDCSGVAPFFGGCLDDPPVAGNFHPYDLVWQSLPDTAPPFCRITTNDRTSITVAIGDTGAGLARIAVTGQQNAKVALPTFGPGTNATLRVRATRVRAAKQGAFQLRLSDTLGNVTRCVLHV